MSGGLSKVLLGCNCAVHQSVATGISRVQRPYGVPSELLLRGANFLIVVRTYCVRQALGGTHKLQLVQHCMQLTALSLLGSTISSGLTDVHPDCPHLPPSSLLRYPVSSGIPEISQKLKLNRDQFCVAVEICCRIFTLKSFLASFVYLHPQVPPRNLSRIALLRDCSPKISPMWN